MQDPRVRNVIVILVAAIALMSGGYMMGKRQVVTPIVITNAAPATPNPQTGDPGIAPAATTSTSASLPLPPPPLQLSTPIPPSRPLKPTAPVHRTIASVPTVTPAAPKLPFTHTSNKLKHPGDGTVDINTASVDELERLPGVGPSTAAKIVDYRQENHGFKKPTDLMDISGIGEKKMAKMAPFVRVR